MSIKPASFVIRLFSFLMLFNLLVGARGVTSVHAAGILFATPGGTGDCSSWTNACTLQTALTSAVSGDEIWVAAGTHKPTSGTDRAATYQLKSGVALYGGFAGIETLRTQRNPAANFTNFNGDVGVAGNYNDNSYHVVIGSNVDNSASLDDLTVSGGNANGTLMNSYGGGMYIDNGSPSLTNINFSGNSADYGGGIYSSYGSPILTNVTIRLQIQFVHHPVHYPYQVFFWDQFFQARREERWLVHQIGLEGDLAVSFFHTPIGSWFLKKVKGYPSTFGTAPLLHYCFLDVTPVLLTLHGCPCRINHNTLYR